MSGVKENIVRNDCVRILSNRTHLLDKLNNSKVLITGGSGFMGCWLAEMIACLNDDFGKNIDVYLLSRDEEQITKNIAHLLKKTYITHIKENVKNVIELPKNINYIIHAAANPDTRYHTSNPIETMLTISEGTKSILRASERLSELRMLLNIGSGNIYDYIDDENSKIKEENISKIKNTELNKAYSVAKRFAETLCTSFRVEARLPIVLVRPFSFIGPYQKLTSPLAINNFINDAINNRPIRILGDGDTVRTFMYGADLAFWLLTILCNCESGEIYNVGANKGITLKELAEKVSKCFNNNPEVIHNASLVGNIPKTIHIPDTEKVKSQFGLDEITNIDQSIKNTIEWFK